MDGDDSEAARPADRLRARAEATDRAGRFAARLDEVRRARARHRRLRRLVRVGWAVAFAALGGLVPIAAAAVLATADPDGAVLAIGVVVGGLLGAAGPTLREWLASRRGARAWDAYHERHVLLGDPSARVRDADRPGARDAGSPPRSPLPPRRS